MISVEDASVEYKTPGRAPYQALGNVKVQIRDGEFFCLVGPSGCGKTTLLNLLAGFIAPTGGAIVVDGVQVRGPSPTRGVVFQSDTALFDWLSVEDNVAYGPRAQHVPRSSLQPKVKEVLKLVGLESHGQKLPRELSGGMRQRVQLARVWVNEPPILLMDEPFGALDALTRLRLQSELERIWQIKKQTVVFITHDIDEAIRLGDRIAVMTPGPGGTIKEIVENGLPRPRGEMSTEFVRLFNHLQRSLGVDENAD